MRRVLKFAKRIGFDIAGFLVCAAVVGLALGLPAVWINRHHPEWLFYVMGALLLVAVIYWIVRACIYLRDCWIASALDR